MPVDGTQSSNCLAEFAHCKHFGGWRSGIKMAWLEKISKINSRTDSVLGTESNYYIID